MLFRSPEPDPAPGAGRGNAAGVEKPVWRAFLARLFPAHAPGGSESALQKPKRNVPREILSGTAKPNMPLAAPKTSYLHHRLLGSRNFCGEFAIRAVLCNKLFSLSLPGQSRNDPSRYAGATADHYRAVCAYSVPQRCKLPCNQCDLTDLLYQVEC